MQVLRIISSLLIVLSIAGCGQTGSLYKPGSAGAKHWYEQKQHRATLKKERAHKNKADSK